jgi:hypothetical protein
MTLSVVSAQRIGMGTATPDRSALVHMYSDSLGLLIPRMTSANRALIPQPTMGLMVFDTDLGCLMIYQGNPLTWQCIGSASTPLNNDPTFVYGEAITQGQVLCFGDGRSGTVLHEHLVNGGIQPKINTDTTYAMRFITSTRALRIKAVSWSFVILGTSSGFFKVCIRNDNSGFPGTIVVCEDYPVATGDIGSYFANFASPPQVLPSTSYFLTISYHRLTGNKNATIYHVSQTSYPHGEMFESTDGGVTWTMNPNYDLAFGIYEGITQAGHVYPCDRDAIPLSRICSPTIATFTSDLMITINTTDRFSNVIGYALTDGPAGSSHPIRTDGVVPVPGTILPGIRYYIGPLPGSITTVSPGGVKSRIVGTGVDTSRIIIVR